MFQGFFSSYVFEYAGLIIRWLTLYIVDTSKGNEPKSFSEVKNKYKGITADSVAYDFGNKLIGTVFILVICYILVNL